MSKKSRERMQAQLDQEADFLAIAHFQDLQKVRRLEEELHLAKFQAEQSSEKFQAAKIEQLRFKHGISHGV